MNTCCKIKNNKKTVEFGIDFGTTNCLLAYYVQDGIQFIKNKKTDSNLFPSEINFSDDLTIKSIKRILGLTLTEALKIEDGLPFIIDQSRSTENDIYIIINDNGDSKSVREIILAMMIWLKNIIQEDSKSKASAIGCSEDEVLDNHSIMEINAVITVPAYFDENARIIIKNAAVLAGFNVLRLINEPTAAALAYLNSLPLQHDDNNKSDIYIVYDLGGGTFDISILKRRGNHFFMVIGVGGDKFLGGDDIDNALLNFICKKRNITTNVLSLNERIELLHEVKKFKENLQSHNDITIDELNTIVDPVVQRTMKILKETLFRSDIAQNEIAGIILAGGSSRLEPVTKALKEFFPLSSILNNLNPDEIVARGAALHSHYLQNRKSSDDKNIVFIDANSMHLGLEVSGGMMEILIESGSPIPITRKSTFTTQIDNQESMRISICQGMNKKFSDNSLLGEFKLDNLTKAKAGHLQVEISFNIDADGILTVKARELLNNNDDKLAIYSMILKGN